MANDNSIEKKRKYKWKKFIATEKKDCDISKWETLWDIVLIKIFIFRDFNLFLNYFNRFSAVIIFCIWKCFCPLNMYKNKLAFNFIIEVIKITSHHVYWQYFVQTSLHLLDF